MIVLALFLCALIIAVFDELNARSWLGVAVILLAAGLLIGRL